MPYIPKQDEFEKAFDGVVKAGASGCTMIFVLMIIMILT